MFEIKTTEYTFKVEQTVKVTVLGKNTDDNYEKAEKEAIRQIKNDIDSDWLELKDVEEFTDHEIEYEEAV